MSLRLRKGMVNEMFIGYYNMANFITLTGMTSAIGGIFLAYTGHYKLAVMAVLLAGLCDMFDGRVARHVRREDRKTSMFGIQIDTVSDMVSFGISPAVIAYIYGLNKWYDIVILMLYACCGAIRLAYFNTQAITETEDLNLKQFTGVPIPVICFVLPPLTLLMTFISPGIMTWVMRAAYLLLGIAFIINIKIKKLGLLTSLIIIILMLGVVAGLILSGDVTVFN